MTTKICTKCKVAKPESEFYKKRASRFESVCKLCKKLKRREHYQSHLANELKRTALLSQKKTIPVTKPEKQRHQNLEDFWDKMYNRSLADLEKAEIKTNILAVFDVLLSFCAEEKV